MITIKNRQRTFSVPVEQIRSDLQICLDAVRYSDFDLGVLLTTDRTIRRYNKEYRAKDKATDILSFSAYPDLKPGESISVCCDDDKNLGDLIISVSYVVHAAEKLGIPFQEHLQNLLVHGFCHLLGYDHETDADFKIMRKRERALVRALKK